MVSIDNLLAHIVQRVSESWFTTRRNHVGQGCPSSTANEDDEEILDGKCKKYVEFLSLGERGYRYDGRRVELPIGDWPEEKADQDQPQPAKQQLARTNGHLEKEGDNPSSLCPVTPLTRRNIGELIERDRVLRRDSDRRVAVPGQKVSAGNKHVRRKNMPGYPVPKLIFDVMDRQQPFLLYYPVLKEPLTAANYIERFQVLLFMEEARTHIELRQYDMDNVGFEKVSSYMELTVPGLIDNRPSLVIGDTLLAEEPEGSAGQGQRYEGFIHMIRDDKILIRFANSFHDNYDGKCYNVTFQQTRTYYRRCHYAVQQLRQMNSKALFPGDSIETQSSLLTQEHFCWFDPMLNDRQKRAVLNILRAQSRPHPYIVFGPPGTGKTRTLVEAILQIVANIRGSRIIVCAPSNTCADQIAVKLLQSGQLKYGDMIRLIAFSRLDKCPAELDSHIVESTEDPLVNRRRVIVSTCGSVGNLFDFVLRPGFFTHCLIDEAAQATEPEVMQVMSLVTPGNGITVLAGDPYQLGPICASSEARDLGLGRPLLNRLFELRPYQRHPDQFHAHGFYDPRCITKLVDSYRCHEDLISVNSQMFYNNELVCHPDRDQQLLEKLQFGYPVVFEGTKGEDMRDLNSASWFNAAEVLKVVQYLRELYDVGLTPNDIGIITPYRKQMERIRQFLELVNLEKCKIATVEEFQGGERSVIIVSTVRTNSKNFDNVSKTLGFVFNAQRFNVATTRAKSLTIVIGDPHCLMRDQCWKPFVMNCLLNNSYRGVEFDIDSIHQEEAAEQSEKDKWLAVHAMA